MTPDRTVVALANNGAIADQHRTHRNLAVSGSLRSQFEGAPHELLVNLHGIRLPGSHSHSIVAGGLLEMSKVTREIPSISLMIRRET